MEGISQHPAARIEINGKEVTTRLFGDGVTPEERQKAVLASMTVTDEAGRRADAVEITIDDRNRYASARQGDEIRVWLGYEPAPLYMGRFKVDSVRKSGPRRMMTLRASSADLTGDIRTRKARSHHETTLGAIARSIAAKQGLTPLIAPAVGALAISHIDQQHESDLAFLQRLAVRYGAMFKVGDGSLILAEKGASVATTGEAKPVIEIKPSDCASWEWEQGGRVDYKAVSCGYRGPNGARKTVTAGNAALGSKHRDGRLYGSKAEAEAAAKAQLADFIRGKVSASMDMSQGIPNAYAEGVAKLIGFDEEIDGSYRITRVRHSLDERGFRSSLSLESGHGADIPPL